MATEDILTILFVAVWLLLRFLIQSFKKKPVDAESSADIETVRKKILVLKQQRVQKHQSKTSKTAAQPTRMFSAYKHLPVEEHHPIDSPMQVDVPLQEGLSMKISYPKPLSTSVQRSSQKPLKQWMLGHIILNSPAFKKSYGSRLDC